MSTKAFTALMAVWIGGLLLITFGALCSYQNQRTQPAEYEEFGVWTQDSNGNLIPMNPK